MAKAFLGVQTEQRDGENRSVAETYSGVGSKSPAVWNPATNLRQIIVTSAVRIQDIQRSQLCGITGLDLRP